MASEAFLPTIVKELNLLSIGPNVIPLVESALVDYIVQLHILFVFICLNGTKAVNENGCSRRKYLSLGQSWNQGLFDSFAKRSRRRRSTAGSELLQLKIEQWPEPILFLDGGAYILLLSASLKSKV